MPEVVGSIGVQFTYRGMPCAVALSAEGYYDVAVSKYMYETVDKFLASKLIWTTQDGSKLNFPDEIGNDHLKNIEQYLARKQGPSARLMQQLAAIEIKFRGLDKQVMEEIW